MYVFLVNDPHEMKFKNMCGEFPLKCNSHKNQVLGTLGDPSPKPCKFHLLDFENVLNDV